MTEPEITYAARSSISDYAPLSYALAKTLYDLTGEPCAYLEAIIEAETSIKN